MKASELRRALAEEFGTSYASVLERDHWLQSLDSTAAEALNRGISPREVWLAICKDFDIPPNRWHGRGLVDPAKK